MDDLGTVQVAGFWREQLTVVRLTVTDRAVPAIRPREACSGIERSHRAGWQRKRRERTQKVASNTSGSEVNARVGELAACMSGGVVLGGYVATRLARCEC